MSTGTFVRKLEKGSKWPPVNMVDIPCNDPASSEERTMQLAFLLPHELMAAMLKWNSGPEARNQLLNWRSNLRPGCSTCEAPGPPGSSSQGPCRWGVKVHGNQESYAL